MTRIGKIARLPRETREELKHTLKACLLHGQEGRPFKAQCPGLNLDGLRNAAGMPPQELGPGPEAKARVARPHPNPLPQERELTKAAPGEPRDLAGAPIKPNQTKSNLPGGMGVVSGQWPVASGWWRKRVGENCPVKPSQTQSNPVKPSQTSQGQSNQSS
jgi:hypothetical protein